MKTNFTEQDVKDLLVVLNQAANTIDGFQKSLESEMGSMQSGDLEIEGIEVDKDSEEYKMFFKGLEEMAQLVRVLKIQGHILEGDNILPEHARMYDEFHQTINNL